MSYYALRAAHLPYVIPAKAGIHELLEDSLINGKNNGKRFSKNALEFSKKTI